MKKFSLILFCFSYITLLAQDADFYIYHTKLPGKVTEYSLQHGAQKFRDVVVQLKDGQFIFSAAESYKPYWKTENGTFPVEELIDRDPDNQCLYTWVRVLEKSPDKIIVHWRYFDKLENITFASTVQEYFEITPTGGITRRVIEGREKLDDYNDPGNIISQTIQLNKSGLDVTDSQSAQLINEAGKPILGNSVTSTAKQKPAHWYNFDEGIAERENKYIVTDVVTKNTADIHGGTASWKKGVSGSALAFDGYHSAVIPENSNINESEAFTLEAWVALGAYPWNDVPIIHQSKNMVDQETGQEGYYLGITPSGSPFFAVGDKRITYEKGMALKTYTWNHLAATYDNGLMKLYFNGQEVASGRSSKSIEIPSNDLIIGLNNDEYRMRESEWHRNEEQNMPMVFGVEGLIDEVKIYNKALSGKKILKSFKEISSVPERADMEERILPGEVDGKNGVQFGAYYTDLKYHDLWDNMWRLGEKSDVAVRFDSLPVAVTYWHGQNYAAGWVTENNRWMADQSCEGWGEHGCAEHMSDKQCRHCYIRIIEENPARSIIHWRYRSVDIGYEPCEREEYCFTDEYHIFYPDGVAVRKVVWNSLSDPAPGWQDIQIFMQPGTKVDDHLDKEAMTMANLDGEIDVLDWTSGIPSKKIDNAVIEMLNFKSDYKVFLIAPNGTELEPWIDPFINRWDHWPVGQYPSDGRDAVSNDRVSHTALVSADNIVETGNMALYGLTNKGVESLIPLAKSWNKPASIINVEGCKSEGYIKEQRAFSIIAKSESLSFTINASEEYRIHNPTFIIKNWNTNKIPTVTLDGKHYEEGPECRMGLERDENGNQYLVIWMDRESVSPVTVSISGAKPDIDKPRPSVSSWDFVPVMDDSKILTARMKANKVSDESGVLYFFECNDPTLSSDWQSSPEYTVEGLTPNQTYSFKVKSSDSFFNETAFSEEISFTVPNAPAPLAYWSLNDPNEATDEQEKFHGKSINIESVEGRIGNAYKFNGESSVLVEPDEALSMEKDHSFVMWVKTTGTGTLLAKTGKDESINGARALHIDDQGNLAFFTFLIELYRNTKINDGEWKHIAMTVDASNPYDVITLYVNGEEIVKKHVNAKFWSAEGAPIKIGYGNKDFPEEDESNAGFKGVIDDVKWYNYTLGPGQVRQMFAH